jgi:hypothetical protein
MLEKILIITGILSLLVTLFAELVPQKTPEKTSTFFFMLAVTSLCTLLIVVILKN